MEKYTFIAHSYATSEIRAICIYAESLEDAEAEFYVYYGTQYALDQVIGGERELYMED